MQHAAAGFRPGPSAASAAEASRQRGRGRVDGRLHVRAGPEALRPRPVWRSGKIGQRVPANPPGSQLPKELRSSLWFCVKGTCAVLLLECFCHKANQIICIKVVFI